MPRSQGDEHEWRDRDEDWATLKRLDKNSQEQYEEFTTESSESRADKVKETKVLNDSKATFE